METIENINERVEDFKEDVRERTDTIGRFLYTFGIIAAKVSILTGGSMLMYWYYNDDKTKQKGRKLLEETGNRIGFNYDSGEMPSLRTLDFRDKIAGKPMVVSGNYVVGEVEVNLDSNKNDGKFDRDYALHPKVMQIEQDKQTTKSIGGIFGRISAQIKQKTEWFNNLPSSKNKKNMRKGTIFKAGDYMMSPNEKYVAIFQHDGNFVIYDKIQNPKWASGTNRKGATQLILQYDGNLVIYTSQGKPLWATGKRGSLVYLSDEGRLRLKSTVNGVVWSTR